MYWFFKVLRQYATFKGRARRKEFWLFTLFYLIFATVLIYLSDVLRLELCEFIFGFFAHLGLLYWIFYFATLLPTLAVSVRRLHDIGKSGWWVLFFCIPYIGWIISYLIFVDRLGNGDVSAMTYYYWSNIFLISTLIGSIILIIFACKNSQAGANKYGENPKGQNIAQSIVVIPTNNVQNNTKECPFCGEQIQNVAKKCRYCGEWFEGKPTTVEVSNSAEKESVTENVNN